MSMWQSILTLLIIFVCGFLMLVILIQRGRGSGLTGAFGGAGGSSAFGAKTGDVLTWATVVIAFLFLTLAIVANFQFDESPQAVIAAQPEDLPDIPAPTSDQDKKGATTRITIPPSKVPASKSVSPPAAKNDGAVPVPQAPVPENKPAANPGDKSDKSGAASDGK